MFSYLFFKSLDEAIDAYASEQKHDIDDEQSYWLHETYRDVFPADAVRRINNRINEIRCLVPKQLANKIAMKAIRTFEPLWRKHGGNEQDRLNKKVISNITEAIANFIAQRVEDDPLIATLTLRLPMLLQQTGQSKTNDVCDTIEDELMAYFQNQESLFLKLPEASEKNPLDSLVVDQIVEHGYLKRLLLAAQRQPKEVSDLELFLIEELRLDGRAPVDFLRSKDYRAPQVWRERANIRQKKTGITPQVSREVEVPPSLKLPEFILHTHEEWVMLMNILGLQFSPQEEKYIWPWPWRLARWFIDIGISGADVKVINRSGQTYGTMFTDLFWKDCPIIRDSEKVSHALTRPENIVKVRMQPDDPYLEKAFSEAYGRSNQ
jgi:hypothetical protein